MLTWRCPFLTVGCRRTAARCSGSFPSSAQRLQKSRNLSPFISTLSTSPMHVTAQVSSTLSIVNSRVTGCMSPSSRPFSICAPARVETIASPVQSMVTGARSAMRPSLVARISPVTLSPSFTTSYTELCRYTSMPG